MSLHSIAEINKLNDPIKQYQFKFVIDDVVGSSYYPENLELQCSAFSLPGTTIKTVETVIGTHYRTRAALQDKSGTWRTIVYDTQGAETWRALQQWCDRINNPVTGLIATSSQYVRRAEIQILDENMHKSKSIYLYGVYPTRVAQIEINTNSSDPVQVTVDWNYDWFSTTKVNKSLALKSGILG